MKVFLSVGRVSTPEQRIFLENLESRLRASGLEPKTIGRNTFTSGQVLQRIQATMRECRGLLVLAFERTRFSSGIELQEEGEQPLRFAERRCATPWHHIELGMASMLDLPTLVVIEKGLHEEGLLEDKYSWYVIRAQLKPESLGKDHFSGTLNDWIERTKTSPQRALTKTEDLTIGQLVNNMRPSQLWGVLAGLVALVVGAFAAGSYIAPMLRPASAANKSSEAEPSSQQAGPPQRDVRQRALNEPTAIQRLSAPFCQASTATGVLHCWHEFVTMDRCRQSLTKNSECIERPAAAHCFDFDRKDGYLGRNCYRTAEQCKAERSDFTTGATISRVAKDCREESLPMRTNRERELLAREVQ
jgi:hypothetical protein